MVSATKIQTVGMGSPCASLDNESEETFDTENVASIPYGDDSETSTTEEEAAKYNAEIERDASRMRGFVCYNALVCFRF